MEQPGLGHIEAACVTGEMDWLPHKVTGSSPRFRGPLGTLYRIDELWRLGLVRTADLKRRLRSFQPSMGVSIEIGLPVKGQIKITTHP